MKSFRRKPHSLISPQWGGGPSLVPGKKGGKHTTSFGGTRGNAVGDPDWTLSPLEAVHAFGGDILWWTEEFSSYQINTSIHTIIQNSLDDKTIRKKNRGLNITRKNAGPILTTEICLGFATSKSKTPNSVVRGLNSLLVPWKHDGTSGYKPEQFAMGGKTSFWKHHDKKY